MSDIPPNKLKVFLEGDVKKAHGSVEGIYTLSKYPVNARNCWLDDKKETLLFYDLNFNQSWTFAKNNDCFSALGQVKDKVLRYISSTPDATAKNETNFPTNINNWSWYDTIEGKWLRKADVKISEIIEPNIEDLKTEIKNLRGENQDLRTKLAFHDQLMAEVKEVREENQLLKQQMAQILEKMEKMQQQMDKEQENSSTESTSITSDHNGLENVSNSLLLETIHDIQIKIDSR